MSFFGNSDMNVKSVPVGVDLASIMRQVYLWMSIGLLVCFGVAWVVGSAADAALNTAMTTGRASFFLFNPVWMIALFIGYIVLAFAVQPVILRSSIAAGTGIYLLFTAVYGVLMSVIFLTYSTNVIVLAFISTAAMFGAMSVYGYTTKADLSKLGNILVMALIGLLVATIVNIFARSPMLYYLISYAGVVIFCGFIIYDTQWIKNTAANVASTGDPVGAQRVALLGAFHLFYDFVQLFWFILRILGSGSRR